MNIDHENIDTFLDDSDDMDNYELPELCEYWSLEDFKDLIPLNL